MLFFEGLFSPPNIEKLKTKGNVKGLIKALGYEKDWRVREAAAKALGEIGDHRALEPLINALEDKVLSGGEAAAEALERIGTPAVEPLIDALKDQDWSIRQAAAEVLGHIGDVQAVKPLIAALKDKKARRAAIKALDKIGWIPNKGEAGAAYWIAKGDWDRCVEIGTLAVDPLIAALKDEDRGIRQAAAEVLGGIGDPRVVEPLIAALKYAIREARPTAATQIAEIRNILAMLPVYQGKKPYSHPKGSGDMDTVLEFLDTRLADESCRWDQYDPDEFFRQHVGIRDQTHKISGTVRIDAIFRLPAKWAYEKIRLWVTRIGNNEFVWMVYVDTSARDI